ncbi:hypothetical protein MUN81_06275 [Hymenobacter sp. 5317J-9]|uniref:pirin family protein n=1 Tax=Hymenobacter sp. 5317J-9 TaxID=2932250 RepID=UPI001FD704A2|nr:hypothetical protein [Hymenobacter sp. 5317J-9]UOQ99094.1 hypothetical protein MUN81_06275 [Hymenobacter sp. 5317J-9]
MLPQTPGKIFLADERGLAESDRFRRFSTFNFGPFAHPHKGPFGRLYGFNEETLAGQHALDFTVAEASHVLVVPITGAVTLWCAAAPETTVSVEELVVLDVPADSVLHVQNPFSDALVSFLHIWLRANEPVAPPAAHRTEFRFEELHNRLLPLAPTSVDTFPAGVSLGCFDGRCEAVYRLRAPGSGFFAFVLAGAFEVEGRLLHAKDGLALWDVAEVELEALSNNALVLVLELSALAGA